MSDVSKNIDSRRKYRDGVGDAVKFIGAIVALVFVMYFAWNFVGPGGQRMSVGSFIAFFFREMFLVGFFGLALIVGGFVWLFRRVVNVFLSRW
jgi:hypothetical protein